MVAGAIVPSVNDLIDVAHEHAVAHELLDDSQIAEAVEDQARQAAGVDSEQDDSSSTDQVPPKKEATPAIKVLRKTLKDRKDGKRLALELSEFRRELAQEELDSLQQTSLDDMFC